jgi:tetratricopeptide (TPR) repeat protein
VAGLKSNLVIDQGYRFYQQGDLFNAEHQAKKILLDEPRAVAAIRLLGLIALMRSDLKQAAVMARKCLNIRPKDPMLHWDLARLYIYEGRFDEAIARFDRALKLKPDSMLAIAGKADVLERQGQRQAARELIDPYIQAGNEEIGMAVVYARLLIHEKKYREAVALAERHLNDEESDPLSRRLLFVQCARAHEQLEQYDEAFEAYTNANQTMSSSFDSRSYAESIDELIAVFSAQNMPSLKRSAKRSELPVFIACMPRSGSTLVEQIIHAHPQAFGAGEITAFSHIVRDLQATLETVQSYPYCVADLKQNDAERLGDSYIRQIRKLGGPATRVTNKHLENFRHLPMIQQLLPGSRVVHIQRDALDNCFSCFMAVLLPAHAPYASDLRHMGFVYRQYERLMAHWREVLEIPTLHVNYEELVEDPDDHIRRIIDFCGLDWDDRCLRYYEADRNVLTLSYDQVRKPIYKSAVKRWTKYEKHLGPLREALAGEE